MGQAPARRGGKTAAAGLTVPQPNKAAPTQVMADAYVPRRGRPKGTGIDDADTLAAIADLMGADPELRPTTAIKKAGVTDPSIVRRLREKLKAPAEAPPAGLPAIAAVAVRPAPPAKPANNKATPQSIALASALAEAAAKRPIKPAPAQKHSPKPTVSRAVHAAPTQVPAPPPDAPAASKPAAPQPPRGAQPGPVPSAAPAQEPKRHEYFALPLLPAHGDDTGPAADILRASVEAATAITRLQMELFEQMLRLSPLSMILKQQKTITQAVTAALATQRKSTPKT